VIAAERRDEPVSHFLARIRFQFDDQHVAIAAVGLTELVHGIYRAKTPAMKNKRQSFIEALMKAIPVYPFTSDAAMLAGRIDGEEQARGVVIPAIDLLIAATALSLGYPVVTVNLRHFQQVPGLTVLTI
jgi:predicted nucleic acid-binding protein